MERYLIRHGQSANNLRKQALAEHPRTSPAASAPRIAVPPLTRLGEHQARLAGESLKPDVSRLRAARRGHPPGMVVSRVRG